ncbi:MAG: hypothetical protein HS119_09540 [Flavobacteriales bacterium]|nr:hypothetical protein [Flavobacteriales bacterium]
MEQLLQDLYYILEKIILYHLCKENTPTNGAAVILESANQYMLISNESGIFRVQNNTTSETPFNIASDGSIGLGGDAQHSELDVFGQITMRTGAVNGYIPVSDVNGTMTWTDPSTLSSGWGLNGNAGTNAGTNFIGTTDAQNLTFKTNNVDRLRISQKGQLEIFNTGLSVFIGEAAGANDDLTNNSNTFIGYYSGTSNTTGSGNNALGYQSLQSNSTGIYNTALGNQALNTNISGSHNIAIGFNTLRDHNTGDRNVAIGNQAGLSNTAGVGNIFLGDNAGRNEIGSNKLYIANSNTASPLIYGDFSTNLLRVNGSLNINNAYTLPTTDGAANYIMQTNGTGIVSWVDPFSLGGPWTKSGNDIYPTNFATENVAIGTNTPGAKLHVQDNLATNAPLFRIKNENLSFPSTMAFTSGNDTYNYIMGVDPADNSFKISNSLVNLNASTRFTIASSGNVGIGTTAPNSKLNVNGDVGLNDGATVATNNAITILLTNSGPAVAAGDIVVVGTANNSFNVTNNPGHYAVIGVAAEAISGGSVGKIAISGVATVNIESASNVIRGQHCITGNSNGRASGISIPSAGTSIGVYLTDGPADGTAKVLLR